MLMPSASDTGKLELNKAFFLFVRYQCFLCQAIAVAVGVAGVATIIGIAVHRAKHQ